MPRKLRKQFLKPVASLLKRYFILTSGGYSVGKSYGARFLFDWRHSLDKKVALELYEHDQIYYFLGALKQVKPDMFIDIGSHAALYSVVLKSNFPELEVHAFEPDRTNLCQLYANLFVNGMTKSIQVHEFGLSNQAGRITFDDSEATSSRGTRRISNTGNSTIEIQRLDNVLHDRGRTVSIKIDVEGHECEVIEGAGVFLAANRCFLQVESSAANLATLTRQLNELGYRYVATLSDHFFTNIPASP